MGCRPASSEADRKVNPHWTADLRPGAVEAPRRLLVSSMGGGSGNRPAGGRSPRTPAVAPNRSQGRLASARGGGARRRPRSGWPAPMPDLTRIESDLTGRYPGAWVRHHLRSFRAPYFAAFDVEDFARHLGRSLTLTDAQPVAVEVWPEGPGAWRVEAVGFDAFQLLSTLCTLLAIHGLSIVHGRAF